MASHYPSSACAWPAFRRGTATGSGAKRAHRDPRQAAGWPSDVVLSNSKYSNHAA